MNDKRVVAHIDMDCFYCQVESRLDPSLRGIPMAVVQYNPNDCKKILPSENRKNIGLGSIIAVNYEARACGVKRIMRGNEARKACPDIVLVQVPTYDNKANLTIYRDAGAIVVKCIQKIVSIVEKASIDEVYIDITDLTKSRLIEIEKTASKKSDFVNYIREHAPSRLAGDDESEAERSKKDLREGYKDDSTNQIIYTDYSFLLEDFNEDDKMIATAAVVVKEIRNEILEMGFTCSAGIANCKMLAKIASGMHKPNQQTLCFRSSVVKIMKSMPIARVPGWGGNLGLEIIEKFGNERLTFGDLMSADKNDLIQDFGEDVYRRIVNTSHGIDLEPVKDRSLSQQIGASKNFRNKNVIMGGRSSLESNGKVHEFLLELCKELCERIDTDTSFHNRIPKQFICSFTVIDLNHKSDIPAWKEGISMSKTGIYPQTKVVGLSIEQAFAQSALKLILKSVNENEHRLPRNWGITLLSLQATNLQDIASEAQSSLFSKFLSSPPKKKEIPHPIIDTTIVTEQTDETEFPIKSNAIPQPSSSEAVAKMTMNVSPEKRKLDDNMIIEDMDMDVFNALPRDIQDEILSDRKKRKKSNDANVRNSKNSSSSSSVQLSNKSKKELTVAEKMLIKEKEKGISRFFK